MHDYIPDPQSGAGNCECGGNQHHRRHPHMFWQAAPWTARGRKICVCGLAPEADCHLATLSS